MILKSVATIRMLEIINKYEQIDKTQWQSLVEQSPYATWFQTPEAYQFYASLPEEMEPFAVGVVAYPHRLIASSPHRLKGICVGYITRERSALKQFFTRRAIVVGGPLLAEDISDEALTALLNAVKNQPILNPSLNEPILSPSLNGRTLSSHDILPSLQGRAGERLMPIYIETRNFHDYSRWREVFAQCGFGYNAHYDIHVHCNAAHSMSEQRLRQVKKAIKNGAEIALAQSEQEVRDWYLILRELYRTKVRTPLFSEDFFLQFYRQGRGIYLLVKHQGKVIGGMMCPILNGKAMYEWYVCGLDELYKEQYPSVMATYAAIEYAKANQIPLFDFMGAGKPDEPYGVRDFKMEFGGELVELGRFLCVRKPMLYKIGVWVVNMLKKQ